MKQPLTILLGFFITLIAFVANTFAHAARVEPHASMRVVSVVALLVLSIMFMYFIANIWSNRF